jgi:hypothetical protein
VLSEKLARAKICTSKLRTRLKTVETGRDAAEASRDELEQEFDDFKTILLGQEKRALTRCQESVAGLFMKLAEDLLAPAIAGHEKAALRQENAAANEQKVHARQICKLQDELAKLASNSMLELFGPSQLREISPDFFKAPKRRRRTVSPPRGGRCILSAMEIVFPSHSMLVLQKPFCSVVLDSILRRCTALSPDFSSFEWHHFVDRSAFFISSFVVTATS